MHRLNLLTTTPHLRALFNATATAVTANPKRFLRLNPPTRSFAFIHSSGRSVMDPPSPAANNGIGDFVHLEKENQLSSETHEFVPENAINEKNKYSYERKVLPPELSRNVVTLTCDSAAEGGTCDVYLVGTAHVSRESCKEVQAVIAFLKPQVVFLELCASRVAVLKPQNFKVPTIGDMINMWKKNQNLFGILYSWFLAKVATRLEVLPGAEFRVAYEEAMKYGGKVILGDRPIQITLRRTWAKMPLWHKTKLIFSLMFQTVFLPTPEVLSKALKKMDDADMLTLVIQEMSKQFPTLMETLVHERDQYMSAMLLKIASEHKSVVAVVGKGHLPGIKKYWKQPVDLEEILTIPSQKKIISMRSILSTVGVTVAGVAIYLSLKK